MLGFLKNLFGSSQERAVKRFRKVVGEVTAWEEKMQSLSDEELRQKTQEFRKRYAEGEALDQLLPEAYAVVKLVCRRMIGTEVQVSGYRQKWDMIPFDVQVLGAVALHKGNIAEMQTGEGKTLTAIMPLYLNALSGKPVHLVTVNDYLAHRDCQWVGSILRWLGLRTGVLTNETPHYQRKDVYTSDVVYGTASEFGFDYLRDNSMATTKEEQVQRGFYFAFIDEIDSILIDESRTPLVISGVSPQSFQMYAELREGVASLVKLQRELASKIATEAKADLEQTLQQETLPKEKKELERVRAACRRLWLVNKGMPHNKILRRVKENPDLRTEIDKWDTYFHSDQNKEEKLDLLAELYMMVDEKGSEFELTDKGITTWASLTGGAAEDFVMLDLGHEYAKVDAEMERTEEEKLDQKLKLNDEDARRKERAHNLRQLLRAHLLMEKDVDYMIDQGKVVIVDEHTGRPQPGRRFSDGLHQAIEAKEGVEIQRETQTYASITLQNFFRMYEKLAGMTGTALTEATEFKEIYKLDVLQIPTHRPCQRHDYNDEIYMTEREKYAAILKEVKEENSKGRPILIGSESVDASEKISRILKQNKIDHTVLNAKYHAQEAEIIAQAGRRSAVTVATNMAGRGTDIKLEAGIAEIGGLHVISTTRNTARRLDLQLKGRSARQGDKGSSKFFLSFEDSLMRLFSSPRLTAALQRFRLEENEGMSANILNKAIATAQKRIEGKNYTIRKYTLDYDDVMNKQRQEVYSFRNEILHTDDPLALARNLLTQVSQSLADEYLQSRSGYWDPEGFRQQLITLFPVTFDEKEFDGDHISSEECAQKAANRLIESFEHKYAYETSKHRAASTEAEAHRLGEQAIRTVLLQRVDKLWQEHLLTMDHLRTEVSLRTLAQRDPLVEFKHEAFELFHRLTGTLYLEAARNLFKFEISSFHPGMFQSLLDQIHLQAQRKMMEPFSPPSVERENASGSNGFTLPQNGVPKVNRNEACPCNSGKKYKKCCGLSEA